MIHFDVLFFVLLFVLYTLVLFKVGIVDKNRFAHPPLRKKRKRDSTKVTRVVGLVKSCSPALSRPLHFSFLSLFQINLVSVISPAVGAALASLKTERYGRTAWEVH